MDNYSFREWALSNIDIDEFIKYMVVHDFFTVKDTSITNYYIYNYNRMFFLPWDNELSFRKSQFTLAEDNLITQRLIQIPEFYNEYINQFHNWFLDTDQILINISNETDRIVEEIDKAVKADPTFYLEYSEFLKEINKIKAYIDLGSTGMRALLLTYPEFQ